MNYLDLYNLWKNDEFFDMMTRDELLELDLEKDRKEIEDRFYCNLKFGTGGLRGIMGAGTNRMNKYTVGRVTVGLGNYLLDVYGAEMCKSRGVVIAYDTRNNSDLYSSTVAKVLSSMGIHVYLHSYACPTPQLSFSVRHWNTLVGIVITASHNTKEYNGYKIYDEFGCQMTPWQAEIIIKYINMVTDYHAINFSGNDKLISIVDDTDEFVHAVLTQSRYKDIVAKKNLKIVYTPLHGTGNIPIQKVLRLGGFTEIYTVAEQENPDGNFPTVTSPNPEDRCTLELGIALAKQIDADIVIGTDADSDRVGIAVKSADGVYKSMTGNQVGALLIDFILKNVDLSLFDHPAVIKSVVTSELGAEISKESGLNVFSTLTGFKFIGEKIIQFEQAKLNGKSEQNYDFVMGYEESYGYLIGTHACDKDAVVSTLLICEMAAEAKGDGKTLDDKMDEIYEKFGYYYDASDSFTFNGKDGLERIDTIMSELRSKGSPFENTVHTIDYSLSIEAESGFGRLPSSNLLKYFLKDNSWIAVRPSGTEPKIKIYYSIKDDNQDNAERRLEQIRNIIQRKIGLK